ncbi:MAG TPA: SseB family protein [Candidatus Limnocylindria bacterium]|nr:SseB family protein [Candidatus Limnocylindria bacterium]
MTTEQQRPAPGSHDRSTPSGSLETSSANLFEAMLAAREAEERGTGRAALHAFYRTLMSGTLLLPVPPDHGEEAKTALASAVNDNDEVEISVMLARDGDGEPLSVCFGSNAGLAAWAPRGTAALPLPARVAVANLAAAGMPAIMDPSGPIPYRFEIAELTALADGRIPGTDAPLFEAGGRSSVRLRLPGTDALALERSLAASLDGSRVTEGYLVASEADGRSRLMLGLVGEAGAAVTVDVPDGTDVVWLEEPLLGSVRAVAEPFFRGPGRPGRHRR